ncbi:MAG: hypothetical protein E2O39_07110 [Planctomycetota bacterium]|nr:MAG: hypothetical protein E2O39_07110 [Planctomycetota bacterium]
MGLVRQSLLILPRPDLSGRGRDIVEFRLRAHDGVRLWGLLARSEWHGGDRPAFIRVAGPTERPEIDPETLQEGSADFVFQSPAGRRLEDRVLDVVRVHQVALATQGIDPDRVTFAAPRGGREPDEFMIARQLIDGQFC